MRYFPFGLKLVFAALVLPVVCAYTLVLGTAVLKKLPDEKKALIVELHKFQVRGIDTVDELDSFLEEKLRFFLGSRWLAVSIVQLALAFGLLFRQRWVRVGMMVYLGVLISLEIFWLLGQQPATRPFVLFKFLSILVGVITIYYLQHPKTRDEFI
jgi:hypothetical protein